MTTAVLNCLRVNYINFPKINWKLVCFVMFSMCISLLVYYVWQVKYLTGGSYQVDSYEQQILKLQDQKKDLEVSFAESGFLGQAQAEIRALGFQKTTSVRYIQLPDNYLARAK